MGKHDIKEIVEKETPYKEKLQEVRAGIEDLAGSCEFYKDRIKHLEAEVERLQDNLREAEYSLAVMTQLYENGAECIQKSEARNTDIIKRKDEQIAMCKEAIYLAAMREVALR